MKAVKFDRPGDPGVLYVGETATPEPHAGEVLVRVHATALNRADLLQRRGLYPPPPGDPDILGLEMAGVVEKLGDGVSGVAAGDRVCALLGGGGYAEYVAVDARMLLPVPDGMKFTDAGALPEAVLTAYAALFETGELQPGGAALLHAGASGIGTMAIQMAKNAGAKVFVTAGSPEKLALCKSLGADIGINYKTEDFGEVIARETNKRGVDVIVDVIGAPYFERNIASLATKGRLIVLGFMGGPTIDVNLAPLLRKRLSIRGVVMRARTRDEKIAITAAVREKIWPDVLAGKLQPVVDSIFPLADVRAAHERMEANANSGKIVLAIT